MNNSIKYDIINTHIDSIRAGDIILHNGNLKTVYSSDIKLGGFCGNTIFGDSYNAGYKPVQKAIIFHAKPEKV